MYWYLLGAVSSQQPNTYEFYTQDLAIDAVHGGTFVVFGLMCLLASLKIGFPPATIITLVFLGILAAGLTAELALVFTIYACPGGNSTTYLQ
jgi:hypothetical protein